MNWIQGPTLNLVMGPISSRRPVTKPALTWGAEGGMRLSLIPTPPFTQVFFSGELSATIYIHTLHQLVASTRCVNTFGALTRCVNSLRQLVASTRLHQLGASTRCVRSSAPTPGLQRRPQCQATASSPIPGHSVYTRPGYIAYLMPSWVQIQFRSHACRNERS